MVLAGQAVPVSVQRCRAGMSVSEGCVPRGCAEPCAVSAAWSWRCGLQGQGSGVHEQEAVLSRLLACA